MAYKPKKKKTILTRGPVLSTPLILPNEKKKPGPEVVATSNIPLPEKKEKKRCSKFIDDLWFAKIQLMGMYPQLKEITPSEKDLDELELLHINKRYLEYSIKFEEVFGIVR